MEGPDPGGFQRGCLDARRRAGRNSSSADHSSNPSTLTALDYLEIQQLVTRYAYALDSGADNGQLYAGLFAP